MKKEKTYENVRFSADILREAVSEINEVAKLEKSEVKFLILKVDHDDSTWSHDEFSEFISDYRAFDNNSVLHIYGSIYSLIIFYFCDSQTTNVTVSSDKREYIHRIYEIFDRNEEQSRLPILVTESDISESVPMTSAAPSLASSLSTAAAKPKSRPRISNRSKPKARTASTMVLRFHVPSIGCSTEAF